MTEDLEFCKNVYHPLYSTWQGMKSRCYNPKSISYKYYGEKGITVCDEWKHSFHKFVSDMGEKPYLDHTLDRRDNSLGYSKKNCRWATPEQQSNNTTKNLKIFIPSLNKELSTLEISKIYNIKQSLVSERFRNKTTLDTGLIDKTNYFQYHGKTFSIRELSELSGIPVTTLRSRINKGMTVEDSVETAVRDLDVKYKIDNEFLNIPQIGKRFGINTSSLIRYLNLKFTIEEALNYLLFGKVSENCKELINLKLYSYNGELYTIKGLSLISGVSSKLLIERLNNGKTVEQAVLTPTRQENRYLVNDIEYTKAELARLLNVSFDTISYYLAKGFTAEQTVKIIKDRKNPP